MRLRTTTAMSLVAAMAIAVPATAQRDEGQSPQDVKSQDAETIVYDCEDSEGNQLIFRGDLQMWPPNHKYQDLDVTALDADGDGEQITLTTRVTHDEYVTDWMPASEDDEEPEEEVGAGNTSDDARPFFAMDSGTESVTNEHEVRSERSGRGDGRTYTIVADATFDQESCSQTWEVEVPHDMRSHRAPGKEDRIGSTGPES